MKHICCIEDKLYKYDFKDLSWRKHFMKKFRKYTICSKKNPRTKLYFKSNAAVISEQKRHLSSKYYYIIHPFSEFRIYWEIWMMFIFGASLIVLPTYVTYFIGTEMSKKWTTVQWTILFMDLACIADMIVTFYTGYVLEDVKEIVLIQKYIARRYLCSIYFFVDVISSFPFTPLFYLLSTTYPNYEPTKYVNLLCLTKIVRLLTVIAYLHQATDLWAMSQNIQAILQCLLLTLLFVHWITCILYMVPLYLRVITGKEHFHNESWISQANIVDASFSEKYTVCYLRATLFLLSMKHICCIEDKLYKYDFKDLSWRKHFMKKFRKYTICSKKNPRTKLYFKSNAAVISEQKRHLSSKYYYIIHPFSEFRIYWEIWMMFIFGASLIVLPTYVTYFIGTEMSKKWTTVQWTILFMDLACIADMIVTFYTGYVLEDVKEIVLIQKYIARRYLCSIYFFVDVISSFPFTPLFYLLSTTYPNYEPTKYVNLLCLTKIVRLLTVIAYLHQATDLWAMSQNIQAILQCLLLTLLFVHWITCILYMVPLYLRVITGKEHFHNESWISQANIVDASFSEKYTVCYLRATLFLLCIGMGKYEIRTTDDAIMATVGFIVGTMFFGYMFVYLLQLMLSHRVSTTKYQEIMSQLQEYMRHKQLPMKMQWRLQAYYDYKYKKKYFRERNITENLSARLLREINVHSCRRLVENVSILKDLSEEIISDVISLLKVEVYLPYDTIVKAGTLGDCMYFLASGTVAVLTPTGKEVCHLQDGAYFGEIALIMKDQKRVATVVSLEICEIFRLDRKAFRSCFVSNPQLYKEIEERAQMRIEKTVILEELRKKFLDEKTKHMSV